MLLKLERRALANESMHTHHLMITTMDVAFAKCITLLFIFIFLSGGTVSFCSTIKKSESLLCIESEKQALLSVKQDLEDDLDSLSSWIAEAGDCCRWTGIVCDNTTGHVNELHLTWSSGIDSLRGKINPSLLNLTHLNHLELNSINANGSQIPKFLGSLVHLRYLDLVGANFGGMIPQQLGNLTNLYHLGLGNEYNYPSPKELYANNLEWLCGLSSLEFLDLSFVNLSKASDHWLLAINKLPSLLELHLFYSELSHIHRLPARVNFTSLEVLDISENNFNSVLPDWIFSLSNLIRLDLSGSNFIGPFPNGSWVLNSLTHLDASYNHLISTIPSYLYGFPSLEYLDLSNNSLQGVLSSAIGNLTSIDFLYFSSNSLKGELPMSTRNLRNLLTLYIGENQLNGSFPESLAPLSNLAELHISYNQFEGVVTEAHFVNLTRLSAFFASGNSLILRVSPDWIPPFHLRLLQMGSWNLGPQFPTWLKSQKDIQGVDLSNTGISGIVPSWFWNLSANFDYVNLCNNQLYGELPVQLPTSGVIYLCSNKFNGTIPRILLHNWALDLSNNSLSGDISEALCHPKVENDFSILTILKLGDNLLSGNIPDCWAKWPRLWVIDMSNNNLTGKIPSSMGSLQELQLLHLRNNSLSGEIPSFLSSCTALENLDLGLNEFVGGIPKIFGVSLSGIKFLNLRLNKLNGHIPLELCRLTELQVLDAAINNISGTIPICFNNFSAMVTKNHSPHLPFDTFGDFYGLPSEKAYVVMKGREDMYAKIVSLLTSLDLSSNNLSGEIPKQLTSLQGLVSLNLSGNHLRGNIPNEIGNMGSIESLDISRNLLSGKIPQSMANLNFLSNFNVSFNNLSGEIPLSTQLQSFNASSFIGNQLCGLPLPNKCRADHKTSVEDTEDEEEHWFRLGVAVGFAVGFLGVISPLVFYRFYRRVYYWFFQEYLWYNILDCYIKFKRVFHRMD